MRIKKLFVLLFSILTLSLCQCTANPNKGNNNGENGNDNPPIDQPDDGNGGGLFDETSNEGHFNDNVKASKVSDEDLLTYIEQNKDKDVIELSEDQFIQLVKNDKEGYLTGKPTVFYDENNELIYAGTLSSYIDEGSEDSEYKYTLRRAYLDEIVSEIDYEVETEKDEVVLTDQAKNTKNQSDDNYDKALNPRFDLFSLEQEINIGLDKKWDNGVSVFEIGTEAVIKITAKITNVNVGISWDIWSGNLKFSYSFDYDFQFYFLLNSSANVSTKKNMDEIIEENLKPSAALKRKLNTISGEQTNLIELDFSKLENTLNKNTWDISESKGNQIMKGIEDRNLQTELARIQLPPGILYGFEQVINHTISIPIIAYFNLDCFAELELSTLYNYEYKGRFNSSFDNKRQQQFISTNNIERDNHELELSLGGEIKGDLRAGIAVQINIFGMNLAETTIYLNLLVDAKVSFAFDWDVNKNNQAIFYDGGIGLDLSLKWDVNLNFEFCFLFLKFSANRHLNLYTMPLFDAEFIVEEEFGTLKVFHDFKPISPSEYVKYGIDFNNLFASLPISDNTIELIYGNIKRNILYETSIYDLVVDVTEIGFINFDFAIEKNDAVIVDQLSFTINDKNYVKTGDEINIADGRIKFKEKFEYETDEVKVSVNELILRYDEEVATLQPNLVEISMIDFSPNKPTSVMIKTNKMIIEEKEYEFSVTFDNPFEFDIKSFDASLSNGQTYHIEVEDFIKYTKYEIRFSLVMPKVNDIVETFNLNISNVTFYNSYNVEYISETTVGTTIDVNSYGDGSERNPFKIDNVERFFDVINKDGYGILIEDLNFDSVSYWEGLDSLKLSIDGQNHVISNLRLHDEESKEIAMFDEIPGDKYIKNIKFLDCLSYTQDEKEEQAKPSENSRAAFITLNNYGAISGLQFENCKIKADSYGGLVTCFNYGEIKDIKINNASIFSTQNYAGTISGFNAPNGKISGCEIVDCKISGNNYVGGCVGSNAGSINDIVVHDIHIVGEQYIGGIFGYVDAPNVVLSGFYFSGELIGSEYIGGIVGYFNSGEIGNYSIFDKNLIICNGRYSGDIAGWIGKGVTLS